MVMGVIVNYSEDVELYETTRTIYSQLRTAKFTQPKEKMEAALITKFVKYLLVNTKLSHLKSLSNERCDAKLGLLTRESDKR